MIFYLSEKFVEKQKLQIFSWKKLYQSVIIY